MNCVVPVFRLPYIRTTLNDNSKKFRGISTKCRLPPMRRFRRLMKILSAVLRHDTWSDTPCRMIARQPHKSTLESTHKSQQVVSIVAAMFQSSSCVLTKREGRHHCLPSHHPGNHLLADIGALVLEAEQLCSPKWHSTPESRRWQQREMRIMTQRSNNRTKATVNKEESGATSEIHEKSNVWPGFYSCTRSGRSCRRSDQS